MSDDDPARLLGELVDSQRTEDGLYRDGSAIDAKDWPPCAHCSLTTSSPPSAVANRCTASAR
jgi:hypothetical protein